MPIHVEWADTEKTLIYAHFEQGWTIPQLTEAIDQIQHMLTETDHPVYALAVGERGSTMSSLGNLVPAFRRLFKLRLEHIAAVPGTNLSRSILEMLTKLNPNWESHVTFTATVTEAQAVLREKV